MRKDIRFSGIGGQGVVLASQVLAEAAGVYQGLHAVQTQFYGYAIRGGPSTGDVVISSEPVTYPWVQRPDVFVAMAQSALDTGWKGVRPDGLVIVDSVYVTQLPTGLKAKSYVAPITLLSDEAGTRKAINIVMLGVFTKLTGVVSYEALEKAVLARVPKGTERVNLKALQLGYGVDPARLPGRPTPVKA